MRLLYQRNHWDFPSNEGLAAARKRSIMLNLVPLGTPYLIRGRVLDAGA